MRLCCSCFEELLDKETICPICNSKITLNDNQTKEFYTLVKEVRTASKIKQIFLKKDSKYKLVFKYIKYREKHPKNNSYGYPNILDLVNKNNNCELQEEYRDRINQHTISKRELKQLTVKCPYCHSTNTKKITYTSKIVNMAVFGIFSVSRNSKQWHCNHCNSDF